VGGDASYVLGGDGDAKDDNGGTEENRGCAEGTPDGDKRYSEDGEGEGGISEHSV